MTSKAAAHVARAQGVEQVDARRVLQGGQLQLGVDPRASGDRQPAEPDPEDELEQQAGEEHRGGVAKDREDAQHRIGPAVAHLGGDQAEGDADQQRDDQRVERQFQRRRAVGGKHLGDGAVVGDGASEVAGEDLAEVLEVLHDHRAVIAGRVDALGQLVGGEPPAQGRGDRVARDAHQEEDEGHEDEDGGEDQQEAGDEVACKAASCFRCRRAHRRGCRRCIGEVVHDCH